MVLRHVHYRSARPHLSADRGLGVVGAILSRHNIVLFPYQDLATKVEPSIEPMQIPSGQRWHGSGRSCLPTNVWSFWPAGPGRTRALEGIGNSHLREGNPSQAAAYLQQALTIYQRIRAPGAYRVQETFRNQSLPGSAERLDPGVITPIRG
jgi:hypothetical protein